VHSTRGPVNTCHVDFEIDGRKRVIEDCSIPSMVASVVSAAVQLLFDLESNGRRRNFLERLEDRVTHILHIDTRIAHEKFKAEMIEAFHAKRAPDLRPFLPHLPDTEDPRDMRTEAEAVENLFFFNCMGEDEPTGHFRLDDDDLDLKWAQRPGEQKVFADIEQLLIDFSSAMGGDYVPAPGWKGLFGDKKLTITHPLGGCRVGHSAADGVVDERTRVRRQPGGGFRGDLPGPAGRGRLCDSRRRCGAPHDDDRRPGHQDHGSSAGNDHPARRCREPGVTRRLLMRAPPIGASFALSNVSAGR
jgi:hypothetical protein